MRRFLVGAFLLSLAVSAAAQDLPPVTCPDGTAIKPQVTVTLPAQPLTAPDDLPEPYFVSVITENDIPTLATTDEKFVVTCAAPDGLAEGVHALLGTDLTFGPSPASAWVSTDASLSSTVAVGNLTDSTAFVIEGGRITRNDDEGDTYTFALDSALDLGPANDAGKKLLFRIRVLGVDETYLPHLSLVDAEGNVLEDPAPESSEFDCIATLCLNNPLSSPAPYAGLRVPDYAGRDGDADYFVMGETGSPIHLRVDSADSSGSEGAYTLLVAIFVVEPVAPMIRATPIPNGDGSWSLRCNGRVAFEGGVKVDFADDLISAEHPLTLTALGSDSAISIAVMTSETEGYCVQPGAADGYAATLPDLEMAPSASSAQVVLTEAPAYLVLGSLEVRPITLVVEGWQTPVRETLAADDTAALDVILQPFLTLDTSPGMRASDVRVYALAGDDQTDPTVGIMGADGKLLTDDTGRIVACDNAGVPDQCPLDTTSLNGYTATIAEGRVLPGASLDAMVRYNLSTVTTALPSLIMAAADRTGAGGPLVLLVSFSQGQ